MHQKAREVFHEMDYYSRCNLYNKYKLFCYKMVVINTLYRHLYCSKVISSTNDAKRTWGSINYIVN